MAELSRKEMSKIICKHLRKDSLVDGVDETYLIASVMDALKEIKEPTTTEAEIRAKAIDEFAEKLKKSFTFTNYFEGKCFNEHIDKLAEQLKEE